MAEVLQCDICRRTKHDMCILVDIERYALKRANKYSMGWEKLDICDDCIREIRNKVKRGDKDNAN